MIKFEEALEIVLNSAKTLGTEKVSLNDSLHRVLAEEVISDMDLPPFNRSAVDGYACRREDMKNELEVLEVVAAGQSPTKKLEKNQCTKIMTGTEVPEGADCVLMVEFTEKISDNKIRYKAADTTNNIAYKAEDVHKGDVVLQKGTLIKPQHIAVLATVGYSELLVFKQPTVAIISTGDELVEPELKPSKAQIRNSNAYQLIAQVRNAGCVPLYLGIAPDDPVKTEEIISDAIKESDVILLTGGVSMGDFDFIPRILKEKNIEIKFQKMLVRPGSPTVFGISKDKWVFGLPGNPVSSFVVFEMLVRPLLRKLMGNNEEIKNIRLSLANDFRRKKTDRLNWVPVNINNDGEVEMIDYHGSAHIHSLCFADGLMIVPFGVSEIKKGEKVDVRPL